MTPNEGKIALPDRPTDSAVADAHGIDPAAARRWVLAVHEAGHVVGALAHGGRPAPVFLDDAGGACAAFGLRGYTLAIAAACGPAAERLALSDAPPCPAPEDAVLHSQEAVAAMVSEILSGPEAVTGPTDSRIVAEWAITGFEADPDSWAGRAGEVHQRAAWTVSRNAGPIMILAGELYRCGFVGRATIKTLLDLED